MTLFDSESVIVSDQGVRYGLLHECLKHRNKSVDIFS
jgi:exopolyphosphatase/pppGpp-phosphohydrolase